MTSLQSSFNVKNRQTTVVVVAWIVTLIISTLPTILWHEIYGQEPSWFLAGKIALLGVMIALSYVWQGIKGLRQYFIVFLVLYMAESATGWIGGVPQWRIWFSANAFSTSMLGTQILRFTVALVMVITMLLIKHRRSEFFLVRGNANAPVEPVRWLGLKQGVRWYRFGLILSLCISLGTLAFLIFFGRPSINVLVMVIPLIPVVLLLAVMNSFSEEMNYRASQLAALNGVLSDQHALLLTATYFGLAHYYGVPYGVIGVLMAGLLGWLLGKSMLETKGFFWAWLIHFLQDVMIFSFMAFGSIVAGGG
jgi:membrane protease YdiL (CAAX protease family)